MAITIDRHTIVTAAVASGAIISGRFVSHDAGALVLDDCVTLEPNGHHVWAPMAFLLAVDAFFVLDPRLHAKYERLLADAKETFPEYPRTMFEAGE